MGSSPGNEPFEPEPPTGCFAAVAIGVITIGINLGAFSLLTGRSPRLGEEWYVYLFQMLMVAFPFGLLALAEIRRRAPWIVGLVLTFSFWGYYLYEGVAYQWNPDGSGANIGLGLLMFASPFIISGACFTTYFVGNRRGRHSDEKRG